MRLSHPLAWCLCVGVLVGEPRLATAQVVDLAAHLVSSANAGGTQNVSVALGPGTYVVRPVGIAGGGLFNAWSSWPANLGCDLLGENCVLGFENEFEFQFGFNAPIAVWDGKRYATELQALSHAMTATFTLTSPEVVHFGLNDCPNCLGDNRGGNSLEIVSSVPEPASGVLLATGLLGIWGYRLRQSLPRRPV